MATGQSDTSRSLLVALEAADTAAGEKFEAFGFAQVAVARVVLVARAETRGVVVQCSSTPRSVPAEHRGQVAAVLRELADRLAAEARG